MTQGLNELTAHLLDEAKVQASEEEARGQEEIRRFTETYEKNTETMIAAIAQETMDKIGEENRRIKSQAEMDAKLQLLQAKQELLQSAFNRALEMLATLPDEKKKPLYLKNLLIAVEQGQEIIKVATGERLLWEDIVKQANQSLAQSGKQGKLTLAAEPAQIRGGFLLNGETYEVNGSLDALLASHQERLRPEVARILFG